MHASGFTTAHLVGNSLGGYVALQLAARGRARSVVAFAPPGGWPEGVECATEVLRSFPTHADWVELDGVRHSPQLDVPLEAAQLVLGFTGAA